ncbi:MAG TPA: PKD domain-containing protein [Thermoanaerobaculia bacterium]|jgi:hypothetical protein|nr:PKD domain-containing protein [Thermoanaerobaculia bacterium]
MSLVSSPSCSADAGCPNGPVTLILAPLPSGFFPPSVFDPGYTISPCDTVTWDFGDGTTQSLIGTDQVTHDYPLPGNYVMRATVTNALGSKTTVNPNGAAVIATSPSRLSFSTGTGKYPGGVCENCIVVREDNGPLTITVLRSLDLSRSISTEAVVTDYATLKTVVRATLSFGPGETLKNFTMPIADDQLYTGSSRYFYLSLGNTSGGTLTMMNTSWQPSVTVVDDDSPPTLSIESAAAVAEGDSGLTRFEIPVHLSAPMGVGCYALVFFDAGTAGNSDFEAGGGANIEAGKTSGVVIGWVRGNTLPELDKSFRVRLEPPYTNADPLFGVTRSTVTIINDDAALYPAQTSAASNTPIKLTLDIGSPYLTPVTAVFTSSAPNIVPTPAPVSIPAGVTTATIVVTPRGEGRVQISAAVPARTTQPATINVPAARRRAAAH